jgi:hypothetical protein
VARSFAQCVGDGAAIGTSGLLVHDIFRENEDRAEGTGALFPIWRVELDLHLLILLYQICGQENPYAPGGDGLTTAPGREQGVVSHECLEESLQTVPAVFKTTRNPSRVEEPNVLLASRTASDRSRRSPIR